MEEKLNDYFATLRNFSRIFMQNVVDDGKSIKSDLRLSQIRAIVAFRDKNALSMKELANNIGVNLPTMTMMIDKLIEDGLLVQPRWGSPEDVGNAAAMLARGNVAYSTGQVIMVDGGMTLERL